MRELAYLSFHAPSCLTTTNYAPAFLQLGIVILAHNALLHSD